MNDLELMADRFAVAFAAGLSDGYSDIKTSEDAYNYFMLRLKRVGNTCEQFSDPVFQEVFKQTVKFYL